MKQMTVTVPHLLNTTSVILPESVLTNRFKERIASLSTSRTAVQVSNSVTSSSIKKQVG